MHPNALIDHTAQLLTRVLAFNHPADGVVARYFRENKNLGPRERHTISETVYAVLRFKTRFELLARSGPGGREGKLAILGFSGPADFLAGALKPQEADWLAECERAGEATMMDMHRHNLPQWMVPHLKAQVGDGFEALAATLNTPAPLDIRVNTFKAKRDGVRKALKSQGVTADNTPLSPWGLRLTNNPSLSRLPEYEQGAFEVQDEGSQLLALILGAKRGEMVADFCAGAGGKTLAIGAMMRSTGRLYAFDTSAHRLDGLKPRLARSGLSNVQTAAITNERDDRVKRLAQKMDRVLVDAPCSGTGTIRRNPDLKWRLKESELADLTALQTRILASAAQMVKPGGRLVYATCSLLSLENEAIANAFTAAHADFEVLPVAPLLQKALHDGAEAAELSTSDPLGLCAGECLRLWPHLHQTDGFFAAVWQRKA